MKLQKILKNIENSINFDEEKHIYEVNGVRYTSVNEYIKRFILEPNYDELADRINRYRIDDVRKEWEKKKNEAIEKGNSIHKFAEDYIYDRALIGINTEYKEDKIAVMNFIDLLINEFKHEIIGAEIRLIDDSIKVAGTVDLITYSHRSNKFFILDWKTNKDITKHVGVFKPDNTEVNLIFKYSLQLSMYKYMLEYFLSQDDDINLGLIHIHNGEYNYIPVNPIKREILYDYS